MRHVLLPPWQWRVDLYRFGAVFCVESHGGYRFWRRVGFYA